LSIGITDSTMKKIYIVFFILSIIIVFATIYLPKTFYNQNDMNNVRCGFPLEFFVYSGESSPPYPWTDSCIYGMPYGPPKHFIWTSFFIDAGVVYVVFWFIWRVVKNKYEK